MISAGLTTTVLPIASAGATFHPAMIIGKFQGTIATHTPSGWRKVSRVPGAFPGMVDPPNLSVDPA